MQAMMQQLWQHGSLQKIVLLCKVMNDYIYILRFIFTTKIVVLGFPENKKVLFDFILILLAQLFLLIS
jgi:hypothetical protein